MTVKIEIYGETAKEAVETVLSLAAGFAAGAGVSVSVVSEVSSDKPQPDPAEPAKATRTRKVKDKPAETPPAAEPATPPLNISTGEEREQDAADEKADTEAARNPEKPLTVEDVRVAVKGYVDKYTMAVAGLDLQFVWYTASGGKVWKMSQMNAELGQAQLKGLVDAVNAATAAAERPKVAIDAQAKYGKDGEGKPVSSQVIFEAWMNAQKAA